MHGLIKRAAPLRPTPPRPGPFHLAPSRPAFEGVDSPPQRVLGAAAPKPILPS